MNKTKLFLFVILGLILPVFFACAVDSGTVDPAYKYAWSNSAGWINFGCTNCNISVSGTKIIGYAWSENYGWISLNCENNNGTCTPNWGITNNGHGALSGSAWGTNTGWIDFSHVTINPQGQFTGTATGTVVGTVAFADCGAGCGVTITPFCGDGTCSNGETTDSCSNDCFSGSTGGECNRDSDCHQGTLGYIGFPYCKDGNVNQDFVAGTCTNPGTSSSVCHYNTTSKIKTPCTSGQVCESAICVDVYSHNECDVVNHQCVLKPGQATDQCSDNSECYVHNDCNLQKQCASVIGKVAPDKCQENSDCALTYAKCDGTNIYCRPSGCTGIKCVVAYGESLDQCTDDASCKGGVHNACINSKCSVVDGLGPDLCNNNIDCTQTFDICVNYKCKQINGKSDSNCKTESDCVKEHNECNNQNQCVVIQGPGNDQCQLETGCAIVAVKHNICNDSQQCVPADGSGIDQCSTSIDCMTKTHNECNDNQQCKPVDGVGNNQCAIDAECQSGKHNVCNAQKKCEVVNGIGNDLCLTDANCVETHNECNDKKQCVAVNGNGIDQCQTDAGCNLGKHNECNDQKQCVVIDGVGLDLCKLDANCVETHNECNGLQCVPVNGVGIDQCTSDSNCKTPKHNECNSQRQCVTVNGEGSDSCQTGDDCVGGGGGLNGGGGIVVKKHNICSDDKCISVEGVGSNQCQTSNDCTIGGGAVGDAIMGTAKTVDNITSSIIDQLPGPAKAVAEQTRQIIQSPAGTAVTRSVAVAGFVVTAVATTSPILSFSFFEIFLIPLRLFGLLMTVLGIRKRSLPWGVVYDSITKRPLDPAYVVLKDAQGKVVSTAITDLDGRYGFLVQPGVYQMQANKTNYIFPSQKLVGKSGDELHNNLYFGENIIADKAGVVIIKNIPLDPIKFDWNEFAKKDKNLMKFYSKWDILMGKVYDFSFITGFIVAVIAFIFAPYPYNTIIMGSYAFLLLLRILGLKPKTYGHIIDKLTGIPLSFAIIRVMIPGSETVVTSKSADKYGKYYCLVPPGKYCLKVERKKADGSYTLAYTSQIIDVSRKGIIKTMIKI